MGRANIKDDGVKFSKDYQPENRGRPKGSKNRATLLKKWLDAKVQLKNLPPGTKPRKGTVEEQVMLSLITKAVGGDVPAIREILDTVYGKVPQKVVLVDEARAAFRAFLEEHPEAKPEEVAPVYARTFGVSESELITDSVN